MTPGEEAKTLNVFNQVMEEETKLLTKMGQKFVDKIKHMKQLKQNEIQHIGNGMIETNDPKIHYFM